MAEFTALATKGRKEMSKWFKLSAFALAAMMAISTGVRAGDEEKGEKKKGAAGEKGGEGRGGILAKADANHDGKIDANEIAAIQQPKLQEIVKKWDTNADGVVDEKEIEAAKEKMKEMRAKREGEGKAEGRSAAAGEKKDGEKKAEK
jgi:hypothetical protein